MLEIQPTLIVPELDAKLWRYMDFAKYLWLLDTRELWFTRISDVEDRFEGRLNQPTIEQEMAYAQSRPSLPTFPDCLRKGHELFRVSACVNCWHLNEGESAAMWDIYLREPKGVAITSSLARMTKALLHTAEEVIPGLIHYLNYDSQAMPVRTMQAATAFHKRNSFAHEREFRLLWWSNSAKNRSILTGMPAEPAGQLPPMEWTESGYAISVDLRELIECVVVSPRSPSWFFQLVEKITRNTYCYPYAIQKSRLSELRP